MADVKVEQVARAIHGFLSRRNIMQYLDNDEDCEGLARAAIAALATGRDDKLAGELERLITDTRNEDGLTGMRLSDAALASFVRKNDRAILSALRASTDERNAVIEECAKVVERRAEDFRIIGQQGRMDLCESELLCASLIDVAAVVRDLNEGASS